MGDVQTSARVTAHAFKHICSLPLVHRPKGVLLVLFSLPCKEDTHEESKAKIMFFSFQLYLAGKVSMPVT